MSLPERIDLGLVALLSESAPVEPGVNRAVYVVATVEPKILAQIVVDYLEDFDRGEVESKVREVARSDFVRALSGFDETAAALKSELAEAEKELAIWPGVRVRVNGKPRKRDPAMYPPEGLEGTIVASDDWEPGDDPEIEPRWVVRFDDPEWHSPSLKHGERYFRSDGWSLDLDDIEVIE